MSRLSLLRRLLWAGGAAGGALVALEIGLRLFHVDFPAVERPIVAWSADRDRSMQSADYLFQRDPNALWTLRPGAVVPVPETGAKDPDVERVNPAGYRGPLVAPGRARGTLRILTLGDSAAFGLGVRYEETFSAKLASMLDACGVKAEVIDAGVGGYTVRQGIERYRELSLRYEPDIVIAAFSGANESRRAVGPCDADKIQAAVERDSGLAGFVRRLRRHVRTLELAHWLSQRRSSSAVLAGGEAERARERELAQRSGELEWEGTRRVSPSEFAMLLGQLRREASADGARLILVAVPHRALAEAHAPVMKQYTHNVLRTAVAEDAQVLDAQGRFTVMIENGGSEDALFLDEWNPTPLGHDLIAQWLVPLVREQKRNRGRDPADPSR
jgi:lysophospholipase L1-like esterase